MVREQAIAFPDLDAQKRIAAFLDVETARIDALIEGKRKLIGTLKEARFSAISQAVTVGFDPNRELVATGSQFIPTAPRRWTVAPLKRVARVRGGLTLGRALPSTVPTRLVPYLRVANVQAGWLDLAVVAEIKATESEIARYSLQPGDVLMNEGGDNDKLGRGAVWTGSLAPCLNQNHVFCVRPFKNGLSEWISMATNARYARDFFFLHSKQSTNLASISKTNAEKFPIAIPPENELVDVMHQVGSMLDSMDALISKALASIEKAQEFRSALITEAVTGHVDIDAWRKRGNGDAQLDRIAAEAGK